MEFILLKIRILLYIVYNKKENMQKRLIKYITLELNVEPDFSNLEFLYIPFVCLHSESLISESEKYKS